MIELISSLRNYQSHAEVGAVITALAACNLSVLFDMECIHVIFDGTDDPDSAIADSAIEEMPPEFILDDVLTCEVVQYVNQPMIFPLRDDEEAP